jgi:hypothetical protein
LEPCRGSRWRQFHPERGNLLMHADDASVTVSIGSTFVRNTLGHRSASILRRSRHPLTGDFACQVRKNPMKSRQRNERRGDVPPLAPSPIGLPGPDVSIGCKMRSGLGAGPHLIYWICKPWNGWNEPLHYCKRAYKEMKLEAMYYFIPLWLLRLRYITT